MEWEYQYPKSWSYRRAMVCSRRSPCLTKQEICDIDHNRDSLWI